MLHFHFIKLRLQLSNSIPELLSRPDPVSEDTFKEVK